MDEWSEFLLKGWNFTAYMPSTDSETQQWTMAITDPLGHKIAMYVPMFHAPIFGPDVEDVAALNDAVESFITDDGIDP